MIGLFFFKQNLVINRFKRLIDYQVKPCLQQETNLIDIIDDKIRSCLTELIEPDFSELRPD